MRTPKLPISPSGTGDLFAALLVSARVRDKDTPEALSHAASAIFAVLERTAISGTEEMRIVESAELLAHPKRRFDAIAVRGIVGRPRRMAPTSRTQIAAIRFHLPPSPVGLRRTCYPLLNDVEFDLGNALSNHAERIRRGIETSTTRPGT